MRASRYIEFVNEKFKEFDGLWEERNSLPTDIANSDEELERFLERYLKISAALANEPIENDL
jgi:hypothetical protein